MNGGINWGHESDRGSFPIFGKLFEGTDASPDISTGQSAWMIAFLLSVLVTAIVGYLVFWRLIDHRALERPKTEGNGWVAGVGARWRARAITAALLAVVALTATSTTVSWVQSAPSWHALKEASARSHAAHQAKVEAEFAARLDRVRTTWGLSKSDAEWLIANVERYEYDDVPAHTRIVTLSDGRTVRGYLQLQDDRAYLMQRTIPVATLAEQRGRE